MLDGWFSPGVPCNLIRHLVGFVLFSGCFCFVFNIGGFIGSIFTHRRQTHTHTHIEACWWIGLLWRLISFIYLTVTRCSLDQIAPGLMAPGNRPETTRQRQREPPEHGRFSGNKMAIASYRLGEIRSLSRRIIELLSIYWAVGSVEGNKRDAGSLHTKRMNRQLLKGRLDTQVISSGFVAVVVSVVVAVVVAVVVSFLDGHCGDPLWRALCYFELTWMEPNFARLRRLRPGRCDVARSTGIQVNGIHFPLSRLEFQCRWVDCIDLGRKSTAVLTFQHGGNGGSNADARIKPYPALPYFNVGYRGHCTPSRLNEMEEEEEEEEEKVIKKNSQSRSSYPTSERVFCWSLRRM